jgi:hypothetical protein
MAESAAPYPKYLDWLRYVSAFLLFTYALSKMLGRQFTLPPEIALRPAGALSGYQLAWLYYGHSHAYALILGLIQLGGGALLLFRKTAVLGAALMLPVMTNIVMINVFFHIAWGAMGTSALSLHRCWPSSGTVAMRWWACSGRIKRANRPVCGAITESSRHWLFCWSSP